MVDEPKDEKVLDEEVLEKRVPKPLTDEEFYELNNTHVQRASMVEDEFEVSEA